MRILILDEIVVKPGQAGAYRQAWSSGYRPGAERRGMTLQGAWQHPPGADFAELPTTLFYLWSVEDVDGWWAMRMSKLPDGSDERFEKLAWWQAQEPLTLSRRRRMLTDQPADQKAGA